MFTELYPSSDNVDPENLLHAVILDAETVDRSETASGEEELKVLFLVAYTEEIPRSFLLGHGNDAEAVALHLALLGQWNGSPDCQSLVGSECAVEIKWGLGMSHPRVVGIHDINMLNDEDDWVDESVFQCEMGLRVRRHSPVPLLRLSQPAWTEA